MIFRGDVKLQERKGWRFGLKSKPQKFQEPIRLKKHSVKLTNRTCQEAGPQKETN